MEILLVVALIVLLGLAALGAAIVTAAACVRSAQFTQEEQRWRLHDLWHSG